ncbi:hypothetical protein M0811_12484 [Anaeramoeba ignava]|uniref:Uncharacterized protein n=1 Tax=Anaeramoeba ignava TaxID=1746090 RepID=A0A9Q0L8F6_ANAIG|nr:hypothetical protein M0811_12484 [Anaeramoeba ignava]
MNLSSLLLFFLFLSFFLFVNSFNIQFPSSIYFWTKTKDSITINQTIIEFYPQNLIFEMIQDSFNEETSLNYKNSLLNKIMQNYELDSPELVILYTIPSFREDQIQKLNKTCKKESIFSFLEKSKSNTFSINFLHTSNSKATKNNTQFIQTKEKQILKFPENDIFDLIQKNYQKKSIFIKGYPNNGWIYSKLPKNLDQIINQTDLQKYMNLDDIFDEIVQQNKEINNKNRIKFIIIDIDDQKENKQTFCESQEIINFIQESLIPDKFTGILPSKFSFFQFLMPKYSYPSENIKIDFENSYKPITLSKIFGVTKVQEEMTELDYELQFVERWTGEVWILYAIFLLFIIVFFVFGFCMILVEKS